MAQYYKKIKGKNYDRKLLEIADTAVTGRGDGRISINDSKKLLRSVKDSGVYTDVEKATIKYIQGKYKFTKEADIFLKGEIDKWLKAINAHAGEKKVEKKVIKKVVKKSPVPVKKKTVPVRKIPVVKSKADIKGPDLAESRSLELMEQEARAVQAPLHSEKNVKRSGSAFSGKGYIIVVLILLACLGIYNFVPGVNILFKKDKGARDLKVPETISTISVDKKVAGDIPGVKSDLKEDKKDTSIAGKRTSPIEKSVIKQEIPQTKDENLYTVQPGDTLISISEKQYGTFDQWIKIYEANKVEIKDPAVIYPGLRIKLPLLDKK